MPRTSIPVSMGWAPLMAALFFSSWMTITPRINITVAVNCGNRKRRRTGQEREWGKLKDAAQHSRREFLEWKNRWDSWSYQGRRDPNITTPHKWTEENFCLSKNIITKTDTNFSAMSSLSIFQVREMGYFKYILSKRSRTITNCSQDKPHHPQRKWCFAQPADIRFSTWETEFPISDYMTGICKFAMPKTSGSIVLVEVMTSVPLCLRKCSWRDLDCLHRHQQNWNCSFWQGTITLICFLVHQGHCLVHRRLRGSTPHF